MSAWLCGNRTLSIVVDTIKSGEFQKYDKQDYSSWSNMELISLLSELNTISLNSRYGADRNHILEEKEYIHCDVDEGQRVKSTACYLYQTCESEQCVNHPLFHALDKYTDDAEKKYARIWDKYEWDMDNPRLKKI